MKIKNWLYPLLLFVSALAVIIAVIFPLYNLVYSNGYVTQTVYQYGWFASFATLDPVVLAGIGLPTSIAMFITVTGVFATSYLVLAVVGLLASVALTILRVLNIKIKDYDKISKITSAVLLIGTIGFVVSAILFICLNQGSVINDGHIGLQGTFGLWTIVAGLILGTIASYLARHDFVEEDIELAEKEAKALERKIARLERQAQKEKELEEKMKEEKRLERQKAKQQAEKQKVKEQKKVQKKSTKKSNNKKK